jgi:hypothetical protein
VQQDPTQTSGLPAELLRAARDAVGGGRALSLALKRVGVTGSSGAPYTSATVESWVSGRSVPPATVFVAALRLARVHLDRYLYPQEPRPPVDEARLRRVEQKTDALLQALEDCVSELRATAESQRRERAQLELQLTDLARRLEAATGPQRRRGPSEPLVLG